MICEEVTGPPPRHPINGPISNIRPHGCLREANPAGIEDLNWRVDALLGRSGEKSSMPRYQRCLTVERLVGLNVVILNQLRSISGQTVRWQA